MTDDASLNPTFRLEDWMVEPRLGRMIRGQVVVRLRPRVMELLVALAGRPGEVVSKRDIVDHVWSSGFVADNTIVHCVNELRDALGDSRDAPRYVQTIPRRGYRLVCDVQPVDADAVGPDPDAALYELSAKSWFAFLVEGDNLIGRGGDSVIVIDSTRVSRHHARIVVSERGVSLEDLDSKNGTFVGDHRIDAPTPLSDGDEVRFGDQQLVFRSRVPDRGDLTVTME